MPIFTICCILKTGGYKAKGEMHPIKVEANNEEFTHDPETHEIELPKDCQTRKELKVWKASLKSIKFNPEEDSILVKVGVAVTSVSLKLRKA